MNLFSRIVPFFVILACLVPLVVSVKGVKDIFITKAGTTAGGCDNHISELDGFVTECTALVEAALTSFSKYATDQIAQRHLAAFFGINPAKKDPSAPNPISAFNDVRQVFTDLRDLFASDFPFHDGKPRLFCNSDWLQQKQASDQSQSDTGVLVNDVNGRPVAIRNAPEYAPYFKRKRSQSSLIFPYWSSDLNQYGFFPDWPSHTYCGDPDHQGVTFDGFTPSTITLCLRVFTDQDGTAALGSNAPRAGAPLQDLQSRSLTLLHEAVHLTQLVRNTVPETYGCAECLNLIQARRGPAAAQKNPDSYAFFALALWYSQQAYPDPDPNVGTTVRYQFSDGLAVLQ